MKSTMVWKKMIPLMILLLGFSFTAFSDSGIETGFLDREITLGEVNYRYQVYVPSNYNKSKTNPVILFLHSIGERGEDGMVQTQVGLGSYIRQNRDRFPFVVVFPQARRNHIWTGEMATLALKTLDKTIEEFNGDPNRIYVTGISMGGHGTWSVATRAPGKFAAIVPICGFVKFPQPDMPAERKATLLKVNPFAEYPDPYTTVASQISKIRVWIFHGSADALVSPDESRKMFKALKASGAVVKYTEYEGINHNAWDKAYTEPDLVPWLLTHTQTQAVQTMAFAPSGQMAERGAKNTMTLPNGEVIWDLNGEWDVINKNYGLWSQYGEYPNIHKIKQKGSSIVGILTMDDRWYQAGDKYIKAEIDKTGFMKVKISTNLGLQISKGWISDNGNKIVIDDGEKFKMTFTRK